MITVIITFFVIFLAGMIFVLRGEGGRCSSNAHKGNFDNRNIL